MAYVKGSLHVVPLAVDLRKRSELGAEVILPSSMKHLDLEHLSAEEQAILRAGLFDHGVLVVRNQQGFDPNVMPQIGRFFDETALGIHSSGEKMVTEVKNILSQNRGARLPRAPQVSVIGNGKWTGYEGLPDLDLKHVVSNHIVSLAANQALAVKPRPLEPHRLPRHALYEGGT